ncbi:hypothetical protein [Tsukamurella sp. 1534]|uniref:hypothetical protein n=1 Tax=Tsukamurella sp. 1534 TaxID=1151061 RepID=UPI00131EF71E|nr:hypothetical protein [Tsukamurella sp. 1534]
MSVSRAAVRFTDTTLRTGTEPHQEADHPGTATTTRAGPHAMTIRGIRGMLSE